MPLPLFSLPGDVLVCCQPDWIPSLRRPGNLARFTAVVLQVPSNINLLRATIERVTVFLATLPLSADRRDVLAMVTSDLLTNAMSYDNAQPEQSIDIGIQYIPGIMVSVGITDRLGPLPIEKFSLDPTTVEKLTELSTHGRGIFIARSLGALVVWHPPGVEPVKEILIAVQPDNEEVSDEETITTSS